MANAGYPSDGYTPYGYLANPYAVARSWSEGEGGCLRTSRGHVGFGWQLPWALRARATIDLVVTIETDGRRLVRRADFARCGLVSPHHSALLLVYRWETFGRRWEAAYTLAERDALGLEVRWEPAGKSPKGESSRPARLADLPGVTLSLGLIGWRQDERGEDDSPAPAAYLAGTAEKSGDAFRAGWLDLGEPYGRCALLVDSAGAHGGAPTVVAAAAGVADDAGPSGSDALDRAALWARVVVGHSVQGAAYAVARRERPATVPTPRIETPSDVSTTPGAPVPAAGTGEDNSLARARGTGRSGDLSDQVASALERARLADEAFWNGSARLAGDWPAAWRRGWAYDVETTRMCVYPPGGIFTDVWPAWMVQWPRAVVAEGTLDMVRLAYTSPDLAQRATLSLFRDAQAPNVPCVFQHGEPNMVAADGSICGTSPAWCIPFYNLERLFAITLDRAWLAAIYPYLARYVEWWLSERTDRDGWAVYKCTWEAGEDDTPRLDPDRRGDNVVSAFVRPVELQATLALSAGVLARFADVLGQADDAVRWRTVESAYLERTRTLWDPVQGRFRDWDAQAGRFLEPAGEANYWGIDPCRYSALAFTPLLAGIADEAIQAGLRRELQQYDGPPWTLWASWSYVVLEAAPLTGDRTFAGRVAAEIVGRVYQELDARSPGGPTYPTPGVSREYWPLDLSTWASCEGYGWGANTASLLVRQVFGFLEGSYRDATVGQVGPADSGLAAGTAGWRAPLLRFLLRPALPDTLLVAGREYWLTDVPYRGARLSVGYRIDDVVGMKDGGHPITLLISAGIPTRCRVVESASGRAYGSAGAQERHATVGQNGGEYVVELWPAGSH